MWLLATFCLLCTSLLLTNLLGIKRLSPFITATLAIFHFIIMVDFFVFGQVSLHPTYILLIVLLEMAITLGLYLFHVSPKIRPLRVLGNALGRATFSDFLLLLPLTLILLILIILGLKIGPRYSDAVEYHLVEPVRWVQARSIDWGGMGRHTWPPLSRVHGFPNTSGIIAFYNMVFTGNLYAGALAQVSFALMGLVALYALSRELGLKRRYAIMVLYFAVFIPEFLLQFSEAYADLAMSSCLITALLFLLLFIKTGRWCWMVLFCIVAGIIGGVKTTGIIFSFVLFFIVMVYFVKTKVSRKRILTFIAIFGALWLLLTGPWYIHNIVKYSNPLYPLEVRILGKEIFSGPHPSKYIYGFMERKTNNYLEAVWITYREDEGGISLAQMFSGLGSGFFILGIPALAIAFLRSLRKKEKMFATTWLFFFIIYLLQPVKWYARFTLYFAFFSGICFLSIMQDARRLERAILIFLLCVCLSYNGVKSLTAISSNFLPPDFWYFSLQTGDFSPQQLHKYPCDNTVRQYIREHFASRNKTVFYFPNVGAISLMPQDMKLRLITFATEDKDQWFSKMLKQNVDYVHTLRPRNFRHFAREMRWLKENPGIFVPVLTTVSPGLHRGRYYGERLAVECLYRVNKDVLTVYCNPSEGG